MTSALPPSRMQAAPAHLLRLVLVLGVAAAATACDDPAGATDASVPDGAATIDDLAPSLGDGAVGDTAGAPDLANPGPLPCDVTIGTGSGTLTIDGTTGSAGQVVCITPGSYTGGSITGVTNRVLQNGGGLVTITGIVTVGGLTQVTFNGAGAAGVPYGFQLSGKAASFVLTGPNRNVFMHHVEGVGAGIFLDAGHTGLTWSGDPSGLVLYACVFDHVHLKQSDLFFQGNYGSVNLYVNLVSDIEMSNFVVEDSAAQAHAVVSGGGIFNLDAHDWTVTQKNVVVLGSIDDRDTGIFSFVGSGVVRRIHRDGGWGWLVRNFSAQLGGTKGEFRCEDNVDVNTQYYGTCEARTDLPFTNMGTFEPGKLSPNDLVFQRNVSAHKADAKASTPSGPYTTAIALIPTLLTGTTATVKDNFGCDDADSPDGYDGVTTFGPIAGTVTKSNNQRTTSCAGHTDPITGAPL